MEQENNEIQLEEVMLEPIVSEEEKEKKKKREAVFEMSLFLILGVLIGITLKTEAVKKITIGFNDYQIAKPVMSYNLANLKKNLDDQIAQQAAAAKDAQAAVQAQQ